MSPKVPIVSRCRLIRSPPGLLGRIEFALLLDPGPDVGHRELQVLAEAVGARAEAPGAPVVDGRDGHAEVGRQFADVEKRFEAPRVRCRVGTHTEQVCRAHRTDRSQPEPTVLYRNARPFVPRRSAQFDGNSMGGSSSTSKKVPETLEFPGPLRRADRI